MTNNRFWIKLCIALFATAVMALSTARADDTEKRDRSPGSAGPATSAKDRPNQRERRPEQEEKEHDEDQEKKEDDAGKKSEDVADQDAGEKPETTDEKETGSTGIKPGADVKDELEDDDHVIRKIKLEETKRRKRLATIRRLRVLAEKQGNEERLRALDKLEEKLESNHEKKIDRWRKRLGDRKFKDVDAETKRGRGKGKGKGRGGARRDEDRDEKPEKEKPEKTDVDNAGETSAESPVEVDKKSEKKKESPREPGRENSQNENGRGKNKQKKDK